MSILGYSSSYFLPEYWAETPLYGEKIIPLIDYILSTDFVDSDKLAMAYYNIANKYKNTADLPIEQIKAIIDESGYSYVLDLLGEDENSIRLLTNLLVLIHQFKGSERGLKLVLSLLKKEGDSMIMKVIGSKLKISSAKEAYNFSEEDYVRYSEFSTNEDPFELEFKIRTGDFTEEQCILSVGGYGIYLGIATNGKLILSLGNTRSSWNIADRVLSLNTLSPDTHYTIKVSFDGATYEVKISQDGKKFNDFISIQTMEPLNIFKGDLYLGVDGSTSEMKYPFKGYISLGNFSANVDDIIIEEWWETEEVGEEDTFSVKAELDIGLLSTNFFKNFSNFAKKYVYPSLEAFEANLTLKNIITFLPYVREKVQYVAKVNLLTFAQFMSKIPSALDETIPEEPFNWEDFYVRVNEDDSSLVDAFQTIE